MVFFDRNDFLSQIKLRMEVGELRKQKIELKQRIEEVKEEKEKLLTDPKRIETFAREKYWMKKKNEDVFILVKDTLDK